MLCLTKVKLSLFVMLYDDEKGPLLSTTMSCLIHIWMFKWKVHILCIGTDVEQKVDEEKKEHNYDFKFYFSSSAWKASKLFKKGRETCLIIEVR